MRAEPAHRSEMVSQCLFGERVERLEKEGEWVRIRQLLDGYEGWVTEHFLREGDAPDRYCTGELLSTLDINQSSMLLPQGCLLPDYRDGVGSIAHMPYRYQGEVAPLDSKGNAEDIQQTAFPWINAPYLWGGKTVLGVDCSGFMQIIFRCNGYLLPRDASQQAQEGEVVVRLEDTLPGDLAFFCNEKGRVTHVGLVLPNQHIIHASGCVRVDALSKDGIVRSTDGKLTHTAYSYRRIIVL